MVNVTQPRWQDVSASAGREISLPTSGAVEIQFRSDNATVDPAVCRVIILEPQAALAQMASSTQAGAPVAYTDARFRPGFADDEEPTWEDAAWQ
jgi:hypothetical protein